MNDYPSVPARSVRSLLEEILAVLETPRPDPARTVHVVMALRHLLRGPQMAAGDVDSVAAVLHANLAAQAAQAAAAPHDPQGGPFNSRDEAEAAFGHVRRARPGDDLGNLTEFIAQYLADSIDHHTGVVLGWYDRLLIYRVAAVFDPVDVAVIASWVYRAAGTVTDPDLS